MQLWTEPVWRGATRAARRLRQRLVVARKKLNSATESKLEGGASTSNKSARESESAKKRGWAAKCRRWKTFGKKHLKDTDLFTSFLRCDYKRMRGTQSVSELGWLFIFYIWDSEAREVMRLRVGFWNAIKWMSILISHSNIECLAILALFVGEESNSDEGNCATAATRSKCWEHRRRIQRIILFLFEKL